MKKRLLYVDCLRGFFIGYILWLHAFNAVVYQNNPQSIEKANPWIFIIFAPLIILATWAPIFVLLSGTAHAYTMHRSLLKYKGVTKITPELNRLLLGGLVNSFLLICFSFMNMMFFHHRMPFNGRFYETLITGFIQKGSFPDFSFDILFYTDALGNIGISLFFLHITLYALWRSGELFDRRYTFRILTGIALTLLFISPSIHKGLDGVFYQAIQEEKWGLAWLLKFLLAPLPNMAYGYLGAVFGIALSEQVSLDKIRGYGYGLGVAFVSLAVWLMIQYGLKPIEFAQSPLPIKIHFLDVGLMLIVSAFLIGVMEYTDSERRMWWMKHTTAIRRISMVALTIFLLEGPVAVSLGRVYLWVIGSPSEFPKHPLYIIPFILLVLLFWHGVVIVWERFGFKYGAEWLSVLIVGWVKRQKSVRLDPAQTLYLHPELHLKE
ncbi:MAG TPA: hypothetical protein PLT82_05600 [Candidatus Hydrogenedens sp.]|nr:hypothetical protein [Candidatus Hydrogenedens sp.]HOL21158.1 hypothetical protein [Candidatus Hydrogenedens sp.]HPP58588.1 hypothetical protein [Candidatus Hydrogenedens sp.]